MNLFEWRQALLRLVRSPAFSATSVLLLAIAGGTLMCVFSVVYGVLYKPLPYPRSEDLLSVQSRVLDLLLDTGLSVPLRDEIAAHARTLDGIALYRTSERALRDEGGRRTGSLAVASVEPALLDLLGTQPLLGRAFTGEDASAAARSAILSWDEWQQGFGGAPAAIGRELRVGDDVYRVIGVMPRGFAFPSQRTRLWLPLGFSAEQRAREHAGSFDGTLAIARAQPGASLAEVTADLESIAKTTPELSAAFGSKFRILAEPMRTLWVGERRQALLLMLLAAVTLWLVTAANVANLFLARALSRQHATAITAALGATAWQRTRAVALEATLLCVAGALLGCTLLPAGLELLRRFDLLPADIPQAIGVDAPTLTTMIALSAAMGLLLTLAGLSALGGNLNAMLRRGGSRQTADGAAQKVRQSLVVAQIALTAALLFGIGVLLRSSRNLLAEGIGFQRDHLLYAGLDDFVPATAAPALRAARLATLVEQARTIPGVVAAGLGSMLPFGTGTSSTNFIPPGQEGTTEKPIGYNPMVDGGYFAALGLPITLGRGFTADEIRSHAPVTIVDELFVQRYLAGTDPLGRHFSIPPGPDLPTRSVEIVGVVPTLKQRALDEAFDHVSIYQPDPAPPYAALALRTVAEPGLLAAPLKALGEDIAPGDTLGPLVTLDERITDSLRERTRLDTLLSLLGTVALALAAVGLYAVLAYAVRRRLSEFGVRMALGARAATLLRTVLTQGLGLIGAGLLIALPLEYAFARVLAHRLYHVGAFDAFTLVLVAATLAFAGLAACWLPALRASRVDPVIALRDE
ncbi:MAG: ABC transporter permease [Dokdonella sp.]